MRSNGPPRLARDASTRSWWLRTAGILLLAATPAAAEDLGTTTAAKPTPVDYNREVRPILSRSCFACHGADEAKRAKGLRLDVREAAVKPPKDGDAAIVPGDPDASDLVARIGEEDETLRMPPKKAGPRLTAAEVDVLKRWIAGGAEYNEHWALVPPKALPLPKVKDGAWARNGIDAWVLARLEAEGLRPSPEADPYTLLRRASLDLRGLPPTPAELDVFLSDKAPGAYERAVDRFLDDPAYGEKWARMWLDLARYADSAGYGSDPLRTIWRYRDWVIDAFNRNLPYDRFTTEQIAGDLLPGSTVEQKMATAFHRNTMTNTEGGTDDEEFRVAAVKDRVDTTMQVWMGLTMGCAKCHSHKYDPLTQEEYYKFYAILDQTADTDLPDESPVIQVPTPESLAAARAFEAKVAPVKARLAKAEAAKAPEKDLKAIRDELAAVEKARPAVPTLPVMVELPKEKRRVTKLLLKGNFLDPGQVVQPGLPKALHPLASNHEGPINRLDLARWLTDAKNPLTARVAVNRYWAQLFGAGIVATEEDFGTQGDLPSHPELLDWLAVRYRELGWDTKAMIRLIVVSSTYRQSSRATPELLARDPKDRLLARAPRIRLEAEMVRDQALALSGLLERKVGGPSVFPPQPEGLWQAAFNGERTWATSPGADRHRRALYTFWRRTIPYPSMATFDAPSRELCAIKRVRTNTPLQAFVTLNDPVYVEAAQALARRVVREGGSSPEDRIRYGLKLCLGRPPRDEQVEPLAALYRGERARFDGDTPAAIELSTVPLGPLPSGMEPADLAAWTTIANVLLNLDGVLTRG
ncbi:PSD1 and planctomycete cytochrome C domain-containing protein [Aquisphaera insulae]|uniref:PSD1 and planctomycete cytochrome C domain-containing protein n=1 Tax=Aquisphaera insulae TaxID=2712864 RepID=UPI0013ED915C|nr:PSD1 and planctomycete cytochrome C domain-containing protein [Aquisphaera insulae]